MDKFFEAIKEKHEALTKSIFSNVLPPKEELEKGRKPAEIGEIREWSGHKYQKTANGWVPYKGGTNPKDSEHDREVSSLKEELDHHYGELDNLEKKRKDYISQHGEEKYNERHKKIEDHIESVRKELNKLKSSTKTTKKTSTPKKTIYSVSYVGSDGKTHTEHFDDKDAAEDFKANVRPVPARSFIF